MSRSSTGRRGSRARACSRRAGSRSAIVAAGHGLDGGGVVVGAFQHGHARQHLELGQQDRQRGGNDLVPRVLEGRPVDRGRPVMVAQAHQEHLGQAALDPTGERGVGLHPVHHHDVVGLDGQAVAVHGDPELGAAQMDGGHVGMDRAADAVGGDPVAGEQRLLARRGGATVAAHGGDDERVEAERAQVRHRRPHDGGQLRDAPAADRDRHGLARRDRGAQAETLEAIDGGACRVIDHGPRALVERPTDPGEQATHAAQHTKRRSSLVDRRCWSTSGDQTHSGRRHSRRCLAPGGAALPPASRAARSPLRGR